MYTRWSLHDDRPRKGAFTFSNRSGRVSLRSNDARNAMEQACAYARLTTEREVKGVGSERAGRLRWRTSDADMNGMRCHYRGVYTDNSMPRSANEGACTDQAKSLNFPTILSFCINASSICFFFFEFNRLAKLKFENHTIETILKLFYKIKEDTKKYNIKHI